MNTQHVSPTEIAKNHKQIDIVNIYDVINIVAVSYYYTDQKEGQAVPIGAVVGVIAGLAIITTVAIVSIVFFVR